MNPRSLCRLEQYHKDDAEFFIDKQTLLRRVRREH
jgi:hypothetical protein